MAVWKLQIMDRTFLYRGGKSRGCILAWSAFSLLAVCIGWGGRAHAQDAGSAYAGPQVSASTAGIQPPACYLGQPSVIPGHGGMYTGATGMGGASGSSMPPQGNLQPGSLPQQSAYNSPMGGQSQYGYASPAGAQSQYGYLSPAGGQSQYGYLPPAMGQSQYDYSTPAGGQSPYGMGQQSTWNSSQNSRGLTGMQQPGMSASPYPQMISAEQIIAFLQQTPDALSRLKDMAGRRFGIDPLTIPDNGIYNCIRQDPSFREQVSSDLLRQGYLLNSQQGPEGNGQMGAQTPFAGEMGTANPFAPSGFPAPQPRNAEQPGELFNQTAIPYPNLPSLPSLYTQELSANAFLRRFGSDAFLYDTGNTNLLPMDLPVGPDYVLGPGDNLAINMWGSVSSRLNQIIDRQGQITLPEVGAVLVSGLTIAQAQSAIEKALGTQFRTEHVELSLGRVRTVRIYVVGDVQRPGAYDVSALSTPLNALYAAGGPTSHGSLRLLDHYRGKQLIQQIDLYDFLLKGIRGDIDRLLPGDTILVPPVGPQVSIAGMVRRPAIYELKGKSDLKDVLEMAGGVLVSADLKEITVKRVANHARHTMLHVQISNGSQGETSVPPFHVQDGDSIDVAPILPYNEQVVYLEGHVFKPGPYPWRNGMTVNDLLHSFQDVMPEPANRAEIIRLVPPDLHPETIPFNLPDVLIGNDPIALQPFDTVRVLGRYQFDAPVVSIFGPVLEPGDYPMSKGMTVADLVRMSGGFRRSAYQETADLSSYSVQDGRKVLLTHSTVALAKALAGDKSADVRLQPGDVVGIRQLTGWNDIGAAITISGEVKYPGTYGITLGERLSSVLKRAGGFREDAYPQGANLERIEVRHLEEINRQEMIHRIESTVPNVQQAVTGGSQDQVSELKARMQQQQQILSALRSQPSSGRMVIRISSDVSQWENTPADIELKAGDQLTIPKQPNFVLITGQVYNPTAISFRPGKTAGWYLHQAGGATRSGDKHEIFVLRADGSVVSNERSTIFSAGVLGIKLHPGDSIIVPEKLMGGSLVWRNLLATAQIMSSVAVTGAVAGVF